MNLGLAERGASANCEHSQEWPCYKCAASPAACRAFYFSSGGAATSVTGPYLLTASLICLASPTQIICM